MLIIKNVNISITGGEATYGRVIRAWKNTTTGLERLLKGMPHEISDGSVLHALSAWHIFPDLVVLGSRLVEVRFNDALVPPGGVVTIGLQSVLSEENTGITWSLALSHLRYYGNAIKVSSTGDSTRINVEQLGLLAFGALLGFWNVSPNDIIVAAQWFRALQQRVNLILGNRTERFGTANWLEGRKWAHTSSLEWMDTLASAANIILESDDEDRKISLKIVNHGRLRGQGLIGEQARPELPFFGLCSPILQACLALESEVERKVYYLRKVAQSMGILPGQGYLLYNRPISEISPEVTLVEFITAVPHLRHSLKRQHDDSLRSEEVHVRWLKVFEVGLTGMPCGCKGICARASCRCIAAKRSCSISCHENGAMDIRVCHDFHDADISRAIECIGKGELWSKQAGPDEDDEDDTENSHWEYLPHILAGAHDYTSCFIETRTPCSCHYEPHYCRCLQKWRPLTNTPTQKFQCIVEMGDVYLYALAGDDPESTAVRSDLWKRIPAHYEIARADPGDSSRLLDSLRQIPDKDLMESLTILSGEMGIIDTKFRQSGMLMMLATCTDRWSVQGNSVESLRVLSHVFKIYGNLSGATIPLSIVRLPVPLSKTKWNLSWPSPAATFACIAMFESGGLDIDPLMLLSVFAMSSGNSIFVSKCIISDPSEICKAIDIKRIVGNVGHAGITMMVAPRNPKVRPLIDDYMVLSQEPYDEKREDNFKSTSLHMSFTGYELPLDLADYGTIESNLFIVETVVSVRDRGVWVADIDILAALQHRRRFIAAYRPCHPLKENNSFVKGSLISLDTWEDLLDVPGSAGVVRANGNWIARLAAAAVLSQTTKAGSIWILGDVGKCWVCRCRSCGCGGQVDRSEQGQGETASSDEPFLIGNDPEKGPIFIID